MQNNLDKNKFKYLKYKQKYLNLKNKIGGGNPPFKFLVIGGGNPEIYGDNFFEIGNHITSNYGAGKNWETLEFWKGAIDYIMTEKHNFDAIIFDNGSESWINNDIIEPILNLFEIVLKENGIIIVQGYDPRNMRLMKFNDKILGSDEFKVAEKSDFKFKDEDFVYRIFQRNRGLLTINTTNLYDYNTQIVELNPENSSLIFHKEVVREKDQVEFLRNRFSKELSDVSTKSQLPRQQQEAAELQPPKHTPRQQPEAAEWQPQGIANEQISSGTTYAVCCNYGRRTENEFSENPRILVCLLKMEFNESEIIRIKKLKPSNLLDLDKSVNLKLFQDYPELLVEKVQLQEIEKTIIDKPCNLIIGRYGVDNDFLESEPLLQYKLNCEPPQKLKDQIIESLRNPVNNTKPLYNLPKINLKKIVWEFTILVSTINLNEESKHINLFFNSWLIKDRERENTGRLHPFNGDARYPLIGVFNSGGCLLQEKPKNNTYLSQDCMTVVDQHLHIPLEQVYESTYGILFGSDEAKLDLSKCNSTVLQPPVVETKQPPRIETKQPPRIETKQPPRIETKHDEIGKLSKIDKQIKELETEYDIIIEKLESEITINYLGHKIKFNIINLDDNTKISDIVELNGIHINLNNFGINVEENLLSIVNKLIQIAFDT